MAITPTKPKTLTQQEFQAIRPKGSYRSYLSFLSKRRGVPVGQLGASFTPKPPTQPPLSYSSLLTSVRGGAYETPAQIEARANRMTNQTIAAQRSVILEEDKRQRAEALRNMQAQSAAGRAAAAMNAGLLGQVGGEYNAAARELGALSGGLTGGAQAATVADVAGANVGLGAVGAPGVTAEGGATQAGVEQYRGGTLPAQNLAAQGGVAQFGIAGLVNAQNLRATQEAQAAFTDLTRQANEARVAALKEIAAGRPQIASQYLAQLQDAQRQQVSLAMNLLAAKQTLEDPMEDKAWKQWQIAHAKGLVQTPQEKLAAEQAKIQAERDRVKYLAEMGQVDEAKSKALKYYVDVRGNPIYRPGTTTKIPYVAGTTTKTGKAGPQAQAEFFASLAGKASDRDFLMGLANVYYRSLTRQPQKQFAQQRQEKVIQYLMNTYWPLLAQSYDPKNAKAGKRKFEAGLRQWSKGIQLPSFDQWRLASLTGK